jgi:leader peptidase (prepilin peptidase)/N-methyltransferase
VIDFLIHLPVFLLGLAVGSLLAPIIRALPFGRYVGTPDAPAAPDRPWRGRLVALLTATLFSAVFLDFRGPWHSWPTWGPIVVIYWVFISLLIVGTFIDIDHFILPHEITFGGLALGLLGSTLAPEMMGETTHLRGLKASVAGACVGALLIWCVVQLGKLLLGRLTKTFPSPEPRAITQPNDVEPPQFELGQEFLSWPDIFFRPTDRLIVHGTELAIDEQTFGPHRVELSRDQLRVFPEDGPEVRFSTLEGVTHLHGKATRVVIPREAMGYGDIFLLAMIGSVIGSQGALFTLVGASVLGSVIPLTANLVLRTKEWTSKIPFGPYLAAAGVIWLFGSTQISEGLSRILS